MRDELQIFINQDDWFKLNTISFNCSDLSSGIYYYKIKEGDFEQVRKMMLLK